MPQDLHKPFFVCAVTFAMLLAAANGPASSAEKVLYTFKGGSDGANPAAGLISDDSGNLFGTTQEGGNASCDQRGCGTVFELAPDGAETILYVFQGGSDGDTPAGSLISDKSGNLFGMAAFGGVDGTGCSPYGGCGTVFKIAPGGTETVLYTFQGGSDGYGPSGALSKDKAWNLYGTTALGGSGNCGDLGCGTVFKIAPDGTKTTLHAFQGGSDGSDPLGGLIMDSAGNLYGTTPAGGSQISCGSSGCGTVFRIAPDGTETVLYAFQGGSDGDEPLAGLIMDGAGNLYGTTGYGGDGACYLRGGCGTVFRLAPDGTESTLHVFGGDNDGLIPGAGLIMDKVGNLYGTTESGGQSACRRYGCGTVFRLAPDGTETILYSFQRNHGTGPTSSLLAGKNGELYGTTTAGGVYNHGVVFNVKK